VFDLICNKTIGLYFYCLDNASGGAERMVCALANALSERGYSVHLISWDGPEAQCFFPIDRAVQWHRLGVGAGFLNKYQRIRSLVDLFRRTKMRALIGFVMSGDKAVFAAAKLGGVYTISAERNSPTMYRLRYGVVQRLITFATLHLADHIAVQFKDFIDQYPRSLRGRITAIPNPVPVAEGAAIPDRPGPDGRFTLLAVGRLDAVQKRFDCLVRAFARLADEHADWDLMIIGDGPERDNLVRLARELGVLKRVRLRLPVNDIMMVYRQAHLFVIPSRWEGFSNALAEGMCHGLPAVGFRDAAGVSSLIADEAGGWLAEGLDDDASLARTLVVAMADGAERRRRGAAAARAMAVYAPEAQFDRWAALIDQFVGTA
jgi:glycosyltransferase involved in cell wall biosynthesis